MQPTRRSAALLVLMTAFAFAGFGCNNKAADSGGGSAGASDSTAIATVNGKPIPQDLFYRQLQSYVPSPQMGNMSAGRAVLAQLIQVQITEQLAAQENLAPTDADVEAQYNTVKSFSDLATVKPYEQALAEEGRTPADMKETQIRPQLAQTNLLAKGETVSDAEVKAYYDQHKDEPPYTQPERAHVKAIALGTQAQAKAAYDQIKQGKRMFEEFVSQSLIKLGTDGDVPQLVPTEPVKNSPTAQQSAPLMKAIKATSEGATTPPFLFQGKWWLVKVVEKRPKHVFTFDEMKSTIHYVLLNQKAQSNMANIQAFQQKVRDFQTKADIKATNPEYAELITQLKNPPPAAPAPGPAPTMQLPPPPGPKTAPAPKPAKP